MKKLIYLLILVPALTLGQSQDQNYVKSITYKQETNSSNNNPDITVANIQVSYFDGLGRPIQQIAHKQSNSGKDIVTHIEYDQFGRQTKEYLPYVNGAATLDFSTSLQTDLLNFYASPSISTTGNPNFEATANPFSEKLLENSPLNRVFKQAAPGDAWVLTNSTGFTQDKSIKFDYQTNTDADNVKLLKATASWISSKELYDISFSDLGTYQENQLYKTVTKDENWVSGNNNTTEEFKNKEGQVVLKRTYNEGIKHDTYYVYDQYGNLTYVLPPLAEGLATYLEDLCYQYKYDSRNRLVEKKLPGKQWEFIIYDTQNRPVATGPAFSPYGGATIGWMITEYDVFGRVTQTGWKLMTVSEASRKANQTSVNNNSSPFTLAANDILTKNYYDDYSYPDAPTLPTTLPHSTYAIAQNVKGLPTGSWIKVLDSNNPSAAETSYTFYDDKYRPVLTYTSNYLGGFTQVDSNLDWSGKTLYTVTSHQYDSSSTPLVITDTFEYSPQDKLTLHKQQIGTEPEQLISSNTYDELGQLISKNVGGEDLTGGLQKVDYSYNVRGWLKSINDINDIELENDLFAFKINYNDYEEMGLNDLAPHPLFNGNISATYWKTSADNNLRKYNYVYDNLNRLNEANYIKPELSNSFNSYKEHLTYDKNGNILTLVRNGDMDTDGYQFEQEIDDLEYSYATYSNKLTKVFDKSSNPQGFKDNTNGITNSITDDYDYDANGNMISDDNKGITSITYNHLNLPVEILFGSNGKITYLYNSTGQKITKHVEDFISADDNITTYMSGGFQYKDSELQFFPHAEGYVNAALVEVTCITCRPASVSYTRSYDYVFNYTDHIGNIRLSYGIDPSTNELKIIEENHYYPFGLKHTNYNSDVLLYSKNSSGGTKLRFMPPLVVEPSYKYKYNGQEWQDELGLNVTAMDFRQYDNALGRFYSIDVLSEFYEDTSPYAFSLNNPIFFADPTGLCPECEKNVNNPTNGQTYTSEGGATYLYGDDGWVRQDGELKEVVITYEKPKTSDESSENNSESVGQPGALESMIPVWGSGRAAVDHFQNGNYWQGTFYTAMAISDVFLVKSIATGLAKGGLKLTGSSSWGATRKYYLKQGFAKPKQPLHHWLIKRNGKFGKKVPNFVKNQMWNLKPFSTASMHMRAGHGYNYMGQKGYGLIGQFWYGTPSWPKLVIGSYGGRVIDGAINQDNEEDGE